MNFFNETQSLFQTLNSINKTQSNLTFITQIKLQIIYYNVTSNLVKDYDDDDLKEKLQRIGKLVTLLYLPIIVSIGLIGNTLTIIILSTENKIMKFYNTNDSFIQNYRNMKSNTNNNDNNNSETLNLNRRLLLKQNNSKFKSIKLNKNNQFSSTNYFIFALAVSDLVWNFILLLVWITEAGFYNIVNKNYVCQISIAISYICSFLSASFTLLFTFQRFMAVVKPLKSATGSLLQSTCFIRRIIICLIVLAILIYSFSFYLYDTSPKRDHEQTEAV
jgi:hypothetical protein